MSVPRVLVSWHNSPSYMPPPRFSDNQVSVGPRRSDEPTDVYQVTTPLGAYDLPEVLRAGGIEPRFDLVVASVDALQRNLPRNLAAFDCPRLLLVGDTHHLRTPIRVVLDYVASEPFDAVVTCHNRHHLHWFVESGHRRVAWLPGLLVRHIPVPWRTRRRSIVSFIGQTGPLHPRRSRMLERIGEAGLPLIARTATRAEAAEITGASLVSFNASLNGDFNMRVMETLSAGGCLVTDRLAPASGLPLLLEEGRDHLAYGDGDELVACLRGLLADPARAVAVAEAGRARYLADLQPTIQVARLWRWLEGGELDPRFRIDDDPRIRIEGRRMPMERRVAQYEEIQERHRVEERVRLVVDATTSNEFVLDIADLPRVVFEMAPDATAARDLVPVIKRLGAQVELA